MFPVTINKSHIPHKPGVYIFKNKQDQVIYVGKAIDLYHRVSSYFNRLHQDGKTLALVGNIHHLETVVVESEIEALILEANLIKKYLPPYNIRLVDDKDYLYIKITKEPFPKIITARKKELNDAKEYFGPFPSASTVRVTLKKLRRIFPWCSNPPREGFLDSSTARGGGTIAKTRLKPCFYYHIGLCPGACAGKISQKEYSKIIRNFSKFMQGKTDELKKLLMEEMEHSAKNLEFEKAGRLKRTLEGLNYLTQVNSAQVYLENPNFVEEQNKLAVEALKRDLNLDQVPERIECFDISNLQGRQSVGSMVVLTSGDIDKGQYRKFKIHLEGRANDFAMMAEMVGRRVKHDDWPKPDLILIDGGRGQVRSAYVVLLKSGWSVPVFGLAKRLEWLYHPGKDIVKLRKSSLALRLLQKVRDEAHRFAITYHRKLRLRDSRIDLASMYNR